MKFYKSILHSIVLSSILGLSIVGLSYANASASSQNGQSHPSADIHDNRLTLEKVPDLNFSDSSDSSNNNEENGNSQLGLDNSSGNNEIQVNDYRNSDQGKSNPWTLKASLGNFTSQNGHGSDSDDQWLINFNTSDLKDSLNSLYNSSGISSAYSDSNNINVYSNNSDVPIINGSYGVTRTSYNNGRDINLNIPNVVPASYSSTVNWSLNTNVSGNSNRT